MKYELKQLGFGELLGEAFNLYFDNFIAFFVLSFLSFLPTIIFTVLSGPGSKNRVLAALILIVFYIIANTFSTALIIEIVSKKYLKKHEGIKQYIRNVIPFILPIIGLSILEILVIGGPGAILMLIHPGLLILYIFPFFYFLLGFILSAQALIVEREGVINAMKRSLFLTKGKKLEILGYLILAWILNYGIQKGMEHMIAPIIIRMIDPVSVRLFVYLGIYYLAQAFITGITSCIYILIYFNQRIVKEGFDLEHLVDQFDSSGPLHGAAG
jgi:hypothetical protein